MAVSNSSIEWTDSTWSPLTGCTKVSPGCDHCYAETMHERFNGKGSFATITLRPERLVQPIRWRKPRKVFVNSMSDLFHKDVPDEFIAQVFAIMAATPQHTYQVLTKRHAGMRSWLNGPAKAAISEQLRYWSKERSLKVPGKPSRDGVHLNAAYWSPDRNLPANLPWPLPNVWLGVSVEDQHWADIRIPALLETPAAVRWISAEPLLGDIDLHLVEVVEHCTCGAGTADTGYAHERGCGLEQGKHWGLDWVVAGGESGPGARPMDPEWALRLRDECHAVNVPFLFKQWGAHDADGRRVGKGKAGRLLDGIEHNGYPAGAA